jgi:HAD superfamily hydrolase (TIGR01457 family)
MKNLKTPDRSLTEIRSFLLDMDGTFYLGEKLFPWSLDFIKAINNFGIDFLFLTNNSSKTGRMYAEKITRMGLPISEEKVLTSGEATAIYVQEKFPDSSVYIVGTSSLLSEFTDRDIFIDEENPDVIVLGFDTTLTYKKLQKLCDFTRAGLPFIATHPDINCPTENGFMPDIGAILAFVKSSTRRDPDVIVGKPNRMIAEVAAHKLNLPLRNLAIVGDRLYTDIALGQTSEIQSILVLSGETTKEDLASSPYCPDHVFSHLGELAQSLEYVFLNKLPGCRVI